MFTVDNVIEARYTSAVQDTVLVLWTDGVSGNFESYVEVGSADHTALESAGWDHEKVVGVSAEWKRQQAKAMHDAAVNFLGKMYEDKVAQMEAEVAAFLLSSEAMMMEHKKRDAKEVAALEQKTLDLQEKYEKTQHLYGVGLIENLIKNNDNPDLVFQAKLEALDNPTVKNSSKELKAKLRKSKTLSEVVGVVCSLL